MKCTTRSELGNMMWHDLFLTPTQGATVIIATAGMYVVFVVLVRLLGQRALARMSSTDLATVVALGAVIGRAALGYTPTLGAGVLALITLFAAQALAGQIRRWSRTARVLDNPPLLIMAGDEIVTKNMRRSHLVEDELWRAVRLAGIRNRSELACVILEPTGELSVVRRGQPLDRRLFVEVAGVELLPGDLFETKR